MCALVLVLVGVMVGVMVQQAVLPGHLQCRTGRAAPPAAPRQCQQYPPAGRQAAQCQALVMEQLAADAVQWQMQRWVTLRVMALQS